MSAETSQIKPVIVTDIGQTLADGGLSYFKKHRGTYDLKNPISLAPVYNDFVPLPHAREGLESLLDTFQFGGYYTVRPPELRQQATDWLTRYNFPESGKIRVSANPQEKLQQIIEDFFLQPVENIPPSVLLIDDNLDQLTTSATHLLQEHRGVRAALQRLVVVGFGGKNNKHKGEIHIPTGIRTITLASWDDQHVDALLRNVNTLFARK